MWDWCRRYGTGALDLGLEPEMWHWSRRCGTGAVELQMAMWDKGIWRQMVGAN